MKKHNQRINQNVVVSNRENNEYLKLNGIDSIN